MEIPIIINDKGDVTGENNFMTNIINTYSKYQEKQTELSSEYEDLMEVIKAQVELVNDVESANSVAKSLAGMQHILTASCRLDSFLTNDARNWV